MVINISNHFRQIFENKTSLVGANTIFDISQVMTLASGDIHEEYSLCTILQIFHEPFLEGVNIYPAPSPFLLTLHEDIEGVPSYRVLFEIIPLYHSEFFPEGSCGWVRWDSVPIPDEISGEAGPDWQAFLSTA